MENTKLQELRDRRKGLLDTAENILKAVTDGSGTFTTEQRADYDKAMAQAREIGLTIDAASEVGEARSRLAQPAGAVTQPGPEGDASIGMSPKDLRNYSLVRLIRSMSAHDPGERGREAGFELECSKAVAQRMGREPKGVFMPYDILAAPRVSARASDLVKGTATAGGDLVATDLLGASFIELLRNKMVLRAAGARVLAGLVGNVAIPSQTGAATFYWVAEDGAPTHSAQALGQVTLSPKTGGAFTDISRKLLVQSSVDVEALVRDDLAASVATGIDLAGLHGSGQSNQPFGVISTTGVSQVTMGADTTHGGVPTWAKILEFETDVAVANADVANLAYITNPKVRGLLKGTAKSGTTFPTFIWGEGPQPLNGYAAFVTNQVSSTLTKTQTSLSAMFFGNWADLIIGLWGGLDILVDPYTNGTNGAVRVVALQDVDIALRHVGSFAYASDISLS